MGVFYLKDLTRTAGGSLTNKTEQEVLASIKDLQVYIRIQILAAIMKISLSLHIIYYIRASLWEDLPGKIPTDKFNAIKTAIHFLSFVKPLKTGTNYPPT